MVYLLGLLLVLTALPTSASASAEPPFREPAAERNQGYTCFGDLASSPRQPVLLIHGTGATAAENWEWGYQRVLRARGHYVCRVDLPNRAYGDAQHSVEYVVTAIRRIADRTNRRIAVIGHSQGGFQGMYALRAWTSLRTKVDDFIGLAGVYDHGSEYMVSECADEDGCSPAFTQMRRGSALLRQLSRRGMPGGPSYTAIGTLPDKAVTPQPYANELPRARSIQIQDICPGRRRTNDHILLAADAVAYALATDALDHPGAAEPGRIDRRVCREGFYPGIDSVRLASLTPGLVSGFLGGPQVKSEPARRCYVNPSCKVLTGAYLDRAVLRNRKRCRRRRCRNPVKTLLHVDAGRGGTLRLSIVRTDGKKPAAPRRLTTREVTSGDNSILIRARRCREGRCERLPRGRYRLLTEAVPSGGLDWRAGPAIRLKVRRR